VQVSRSWSCGDGFLLGLASSVGAVLVLLPFLPAFSARAGVAMTIAAGLGLLAAVVEAFLASSDSRDGGLYAHASRLLSRPLGSIISFACIVLGSFLWMALAGWVGATVVLAPSVRALGLLVHSQALYSAGFMLENAGGAMAVTALATVWAIFVSRMRAGYYRRMQRWAVGLGLLALVLAVGLLFIFGPSSTVSSTPALFNRDTVALWAGSLGSTGIPALTLVLLFPLLRVLAASQHAGQIRAGAKVGVQLVTIVGPVAATSAGLVLLLAVGSWSYGPVSTVALHLSHAIPSWSVRAPLVWVGSRNSLLMVLVALAVNAWYWMWPPAIALAASRTLGAMADDGALPSATQGGTLGFGLRCDTALLFGAVCLPVSVLLVNAGVTRLLANGVALDLMMACVTGVVASLLPFLRREFYRGSTAAAYEIFHAPLITVAGTALAITSGVAVALLLAGLSFASLPLVLPSCVLLPAAFLAAGALYEILLLHHRRRYLSDGLLLYEPIAPSRDGRLPD
jgi:hypothetical protein